MTIKTVYLWLLLVAMGIAGCEKARPANRPATADKKQPAQDANAQSQKLSSMFPGDNTSASVSRTPDMPAYHWPADFKLPLIINIDTPETPPLIININTPETPKEIQKPSPPIEKE